MAGTGEDRRRWFMFGTVPSRVVWFLLLAPSAALAQQAEKRATALPLPDAPLASSLSKLAPAIRSESMRNLSPTEIFRTFDQAVRSPATTRLGAPGNPTQLSDLEFRDNQSQNSSGRFFEKYLSPSAVKRSRTFHPAPDGSVMARTKYAASSVLFQRDETGKKRLNTSYLLSVLASTAADSAKTPYWRRSAAQPFSDFGSTVGNDAGMNLFHQFEPQLRQIAKSHAPRFLSRIGSEIESKIEGKVAGGVGRR